jgi:carbamoyltransferase
LVKKNYISIKDPNQKKTARLIASGEIIAFCVGKMEFGSRALGARSFVCDPSNLIAKKKLNDLIKKRDFWMPFTPSILKESYSKYIINPKKISSDFMTIAFDTTPLGKKHLKAAIHPEDFTSRPQIVDKKINPKYHNLIKEFKKISGVGAVLNTSLNVHEKPIISKPIDIINEFLSSRANFLNYIYVDDSLYCLKKSKR